jgi:3-phosphoshikimate 1-carboxyvinyltransferase
MARVSAPLNQMGALVVPRGKHKDAVTPPIDIQPAPALRAISHQSKVASAQVKSAVLLAGLWCDGKTSVSEPALSRDHTERMLRGMGVEVESRVEANGQALASLQGMPGADLSPLRVTVAGDPSSANFWACAAVMQDRGFRMSNMLLNPTRLGFVEVLRRMGAKLTLTEEREEGGEKIGALAIAAGASLRATQVDPHEIPTLVDEIPMLAIASLWAKGQSRFCGVQELRVKESDRLAAIIDFIKTLGGNAWAEGNDLLVEGLGGAPRGPESKNWSYETLSDHRLAMAAVITADALQREITLDDSECIKVSYPGFFEDREKVSKV